MSARGSDPGKGRGDGSLDILRVIDRLEVGPPRLSPRGLAAEYRVTREGRTEEFELAYRFQEDVFDPEEAASGNLAAMAAAQAALNYGLFCREIRFLGPFDAEDRRFLRAMAANTAREIYVKKFLEPNPFLTGPASQLPPVRRRDYLQADLVFPDPPPPSRGAKEGAAGWRPDRGRHAVLSSGGKDSLLSFALLREIGVEVHPVFLNESGRHWYTALNAYRHFRRTVPETARVWTNSDRLFAWMLRHLPFVRPDFAAIRSDEYPIRLWTVAVFLFGALPVARRRGVGRIVIGDEFDTTVRASRAGIPHFGGLFDQSRHFDNALTRYYHAKRWGITQFSVVRPLGELLIQKILAERYPDLHQHQVSCHMTHLEGDRVRPCGRCEKCRRIVTMLVAIGADPGACGYRNDQVEPCLRGFLARGATQEAESVHHLVRLLERAGRIPPGATLAFQPREHPEILQVRFDPERARIEEIPADLRQPLLDIVLKHADGAIRRRGRLWVPVDPRRDLAVLQANPFEAPPPRSVAAGPPEARGRSGPKDYLLGELTWPAARKRFRETDVALLPVGSVEQHGLHLPLDTDAWDAAHLARRVAAACRPPRPLVLPLIPYGVSYHHEEFSGTLSVGPEALARMVYDVGMSAARHGITKLLIVNGHGGNIPALRYAAQRINQDAHIFTCVDTGESSDPDVARITVTPNDVHAGEVETSTGLATRPGLVDMRRARKFVPKFSSQYLDFTSSRSVEWYAHTQRISPSGVLGDPTRASRKKGREILRIMTEHLVRFVESLQGMSLDEIYQRRY